MAAAALERALGSAPGPVLVLGPAGSGRTSLLLRAALAGGGDGPRALFLAPRAPRGLPGGDTDPRALQRLELRYPPSRRALARELRAVAARARPPRLLLLDGTEHYVSSRGSAAAAALAALLLEAARGPPGSPPGRIVASLRLPPPGPLVLPALRRFFPVECHLRGTPPRRLRALLAQPGAPPRSWRLRVGPRGKLGEGPDDGDSDSDGDSGGDGEEDADWAGRWLGGGDDSGDSGDGEVCPGWS